MSFSFAPPPPPPLALGICPFGYDRADLVPPTTNLAMSASVKDEHGLTALHQLVHAISHTRSSDTQLALLNIFDRLAAKVPSSAFFAGHEPLLPYAVRMLSGAPAVLNRIVSAIESRDAPGWCVPYVRCSEDGAGTATHYPCGAKREVPLPCSSTTSYPTTTPDYDASASLLEDVIKFAAELLEILGAKNVESLVTKFDSIKAKPLPNDLVSAVTDALQKAAVHMGLQVPSPTEQDVKPILSLLLPFLGSILNYVSDVENLASFNPTPIELLMAFNKVMEKLRSFKVPSVLPDAGETSTPPFNPFEFLAKKADEDAAFNPLVSLVKQMAAAQGNKEGSDSDSE